MTHSVPIRLHSVLCFATAWFAITLQCASAEAIDRFSGDPGLALRPAVLSLEDEKLVRGWFKELGSEDFDARNAAQAKLVGKGPGVTAIAQEFFNDPDPEIASNARKLRSKIFLNYDGYLPVDPELKGALEKSMSGKPDWVKDTNNAILPLMTIIDVCKKHNIRAEIDTSSADPRFAQPAGDGIMESPQMMHQMTLHQFVTNLALFSNTSVIPRGDTLLITSAENVKRLSIQRYTFDWSSLELSRDDAGRVEKELLTNLPNGTEIHAASSALVITGTEESIQRAARLISLLRRNAPDAIWPRPEKIDETTLLAKLSAPAPVQISTQNPDQVVDEFRKKKCDVFFQSLDGSISEKYVPVQLNPAEPVAFQMATLNLNVTRGAMPLGLALRWCQRRAKMLQFQQAPSTSLVYTVVSDGRIAMQHRWTSALSSDCVGGADVTFFYKKPNDFSETNDALVRKQLIETLEPHLDLFPAIEMNGQFRVVRGRLIMQGCAASLQRVLTLVGDWRTRGKPPEAPAWRTALDAALNAQVEWDGRGMTAGRIITALRQLGNVNILLEDSPDAAAHFELAPKDAELLAPGRYAFKELLNDLSAKTKAKWTLEFGAIVITP